ncbi:hypothetical protein D3C76_1233810 [compost metagenome]
MGDFPLSTGHRLHGTTPDLGLVGGGVEGEGQHGAPVGIAEEPPDTQFLQFGTQLAGSVVDQEGLGQQRRAAEQVGVAERQAPQPADPAHPRRRQRQRQQRAEGHREQDDLQGHAQAGEHARAVGRKQFQFHAQLRT